jgi:hypothetical protein
MILKHIQDKEQKFAIPITVGPVFTLRGAYNCNPYGKRRNHLDALFSMQLHLGPTLCASVLETAFLRVPASCVRFVQCLLLKQKYYPSARSASVSNAVCGDVDVFGTNKVSLDHIL